MSERSKICKSVLELKQFLNTISDEHLENITFSCSYSDEVEEGSADVCVVWDEEESICEIIGSAECV